MVNFMNKEAKPETEHVEVPVKHTDEELAHSDQVVKMMGDERIELTEEEDRRIRRKTDKRILVVLCWVVSLSWASLFFLALIYSFWTPL